MLSFCTAPSFLASFHRPACGTCTGIDLVSRLQAPIDRFVSIAHDKPGEDRVLLTYQDRSTYSL